MMKETTYLIHIYILIIILFIKMQTHSTNSSGAQIGSMSLKTPSMSDNNQFNPMHYQSRELDDSSVLKSL